MVSGERVEIRPNVARNVALAGGCCLVFVVTGAWMIITQPGLMSLFLGGFVVVFFGSLLTRTPAMARRKVTLALTTDALERVFPQGVATIPWADVAAVGVTSTGGGPRKVGILLHSYDRYVEQMPPELAAYFERGDRFLMSASGVAAVIALGQALGMLTDYGRTRGTASRLALTRERSGYDILLAWSELDRPARDFVALLREHMAAGLHAP